LEIIRGFGDQIQVHPGPHKGANAARNKLTALAKGEWLQYLDADDLLLPGKVTEQIKLLNQHNGDLDVIYSPMICRDVYRPERDFATQISSDDKIVNFIRWEPFNTIGMLLRREVVLKAGGWKEDQPCCQEHEMVLRLIMAEKRFAPLKKPGAVAQFHGADSVSHRDPARVIRTRMEITDRAAAYLDYSGELTSARQRALLTARLESARSLYPWDPSAAERLCERALGAGPFLPDPSPALPARYLVAVRTMGFLGAERLAAKIRPPRYELDRVVGNRPKPLVSILIPSHNSEPWIAQCITSALAQDYPNKEVIVVDDGSTDASFKIIQAFGDRVRSYPGPHMGGNAARNRLTSLARGEWLQYLDADDYLLPEKLTRQVDLLAFSESADVIYAPVICQSPLSPGTEHVTRIQSDDEILNFIRWEPFQTTGMLFRRQAVLDAGGWNENQPCCQEHELLLRLLQTGSHFMAAKERGSIYRVSKGSVSRKDPLRVIRARMEITDRAVEYLRSIGGLTRERRKAVFVARMESARSSVANDPEFAEELCKKAFAVAGLWGISSPALRLRYRIAFWLLGFQRTERLATSMRKRRVK
jgi:glycosyltransferase involved in cell wall biosynthesis